MTDPAGQHVLLLGATGLVGAAVLAQLLADDRVARITAPTRRAVPLADPRLHNPLVDFQALPACDWWAADALICCLGSTRRQAGSLEALARIDRDYPLHAAARARAAGTPCFVLNSALGADVRSRFAYNRIKGELEERLRAQHWPSLVLVRPGLIGGQRAQRRPGEHLAGQVLSVLGPVLPRRWRINPADNIARALVHSALAAPAGETLIDAAQLA